MSYEINNNDSFIQDLFLKADYANDLAATKKDKIKRAVVDGTYFDKIITLLDGLLINKDNLNFHQKKLINELREHFELLKNNYFLVDKNKLR